MIFKLLWILISSIIGFAISAIFSGRLKIPRNLYLLIYIPVVVMLFFAFIRFNDLSFVEILIKNWYWGLLGAAILPHIAMHITAMIHGRKTTGQVPPHYIDS